PDFVDVPEPSGPGEGETLCRTLQLGVCGTDREILAAAQPWRPEEEDFLILGHECLARVEAVGAGASGIQVGDLVVPTVRRGFADAVHRVDMQAFGEYTERGIVRHHGFSTPYWTEDPRHLFRIDPALADVAVLTEPLAVAEKAANEALLLQSARLGEDFWKTSPPRTLITGMGPIAFAGVLACRARGWPVTMLGRDAPDTFRARTAVALGADYLRLADADWEPNDVEADGFDLILECTGNDALTVEITGGLASRGVVVWLGAARIPTPGEHNVARMMRNGLLRNHIHLGCVNAAPRDFEDALSHLAEYHRSHPQELQSLITARISPDDALWHFEHRQPQGIKVVLMYEDFSPAG
ncbi:MAG: alcohol dehydrogenase catalytic domain-containing protein, partial [Planctomycetales bacterium]